jgi:hypothetical protein
MDDLTRLPGEAAAAGTLASSAAGCGHFYASRGAEPLFARALFD